MKRPVRVAENLQMYWRVADVLAIGFDSRARRRSLNQYIMRNRAVRPALSTRRNCFSPGKKGHRDQACGAYQRSIHLETHSLRISDFTTRMAGVLFQRDFVARSFALFRFRVSSRMDPGSHMF